MRSVLGLLILTAGTISAQTANAKPTFEAAFIKANNTGSGSSSSNGTKGQLVMVNQSLRRLVERAYNVKAFQVVAPDWLDGVKFDVTAKYPEGTENSERPAMLRTLLEERFKLATHNETKELPAYALVLSKGGLKIKPVESTKNGGTNSNSHNGAVSVQATSIPMADVADFLARRLGAVVIDKTTIEGFYSFDLHWTTDDPNGGPSGGAAEFAAIQEAFGTLGLHLQSTKAPVQVVVVDHVERVPTEN